MRVRFAIVVLSLLGAAPAAPEEPPACVGAAARAALPTWLARIPAPRAAELGVGSEHARRFATVGPPYRLHVIRPEALRAYQGGAPVDALLTRLGQWYVPVLVDGQPVAFLVVEHDGGRCEAVSLGHARLAARVGEAVRGGAGRAAGPPRLVACPQAGAYFLAAPETEPRLLRALTGGEGRAAGARADGWEDLEDVVRRLRPAVEASLAGERR